MGRTEEGHVKVAGINSSSRQRQATASRLSLLLLLSQKRQWWQFTRQLKPVANQSAGDTPARRFARGTCTYLSPQNVHATSEQRWR